MSDSEPELGLGIVRAGGHGQVKIEFPASGETRIYAIESAPLRRVRFTAGDRISTNDGRELEVESVREEDGLRFHITSAGEIAEPDLADSMSFSKPEDRLFGGKLDDPAEFDLRGESLARRAEMRRSPLRGLVGARMDLIPHQLFIADEVANRPHPRVLLADEVGLGKTIEACLIIHRLLLTGRAARVLVLVPEPLVHQWFVELLRRFQLPFDLYDEERCQMAEEEDADANPFAERQSIIAPLDLLAGDERRAAQAIEAGWDVVVVDEAHHLEWSPEKPGPAYEVVRKLAERTPGLLLLTATPRQLGPEGHFARLQLLDPERYADLETYREETRHYEEVAAAVDHLAGGGAADARIKALAEGRPRLGQRLADLEGDLPEARERLISDLLDSFGLGRVMFRNTRGKLGGFPKREPHLVPLAGDDALDAKIEWLGRLLDKFPSEEKLLVIVKTRELAEHVLEKLRSATGVVGALFHEDLTLIQRDRNAVFFADEDGARVLVCSEIGSEGRNFQFARHLVLLDLPDDVDLLEQRIGRLDRIGQKGTIHIHVPYLTGAAEEVRARWLDQGMDAFRSSPPGAPEIQRDVSAKLAAAMETHDPEDVRELLAATRDIRRRIADQLAQGHDRLLELTSHRPTRSAWLMEEIRKRDTAAEFEDFVLRIFEHAGLHIEDLGRRRYFLLPGNLKSDAFPSLPDEGITVTFDRGRALEREHEAFLTWDHPMVRAALDLLLGSEAGNAAFAVWDHAGPKELLLEALVIVESVAPAHLHAERFLPQTPLRVMVDHQGGDRTAAPPTGTLRRGDPASLLRNESFKRKVLPAMLCKIRDTAAIRAKEVVAGALEMMVRATTTEIERLADLAKINDHVHDEDIRALEQTRADLETAIRHARVRLDAVRLIWKAPATG